MKIRMILAMAAAVCGVVILFAQQRPAGPYTQEQAAAGRAIYQTSCASCHSADLSGRKGRNWRAPTSWPSGATGPPAS